MRNYYINMLVFAENIYFSVSVKHCMATIGNANFIKPFGYLFMEHTMYMQLIINLLHESVIQSRIIDCKLFRVPSFMVNI